MILVDDDWVGELNAMSEEDRQQWLTLEDHPTIEKHWLVNGFDRFFLHRFGEVLEGHKIVSPFTYPRFEERARELGYKIAFIDDPTDMLKWASSLTEEKPEVAVKSDFPDTVNGFLQFQVQGYNFAKNLRGAVQNWSTGTGKTVVAAGLTRYNRDFWHYDLCLWVVKTTNKVNTQRALKELVDLDSTVMDGTPVQREELYALVEEEAANGEQPILVLNYEKFRDDEVEMTRLVEGRRVFIVWDEMPTKLKSRTTHLYRAVGRVLYNCAPAVDWEKMRAGDMKQIMLSATPVENSPENFFSCVRLLDPSIYGTVEQFYSTYVARFNQWHKPSQWRDLDLLGARAAPITHQVDKSDPDIAAQFPEVIRETVFVDMTDAQQKIYDRLMKQYKEDGSLNDLDSAALFAKIGVAQMITNHPIMAYNSAKSHEAAIEILKEGGFPTELGSKLAARLAAAVSHKTLQDAEPAKLSVLGDILEGLVPGDKALIFSTYNKALLPYISEALTKWGYDHVVYSGSMSMKEKQAAEDRFKTDPTCQIFLSSDAGSDSLNFEVANHVIHYDLPWNWSTLQQRQNRAHRITSRFEKVRFYTLLVTNSVEDRRMSVINRKAGYHDQVFKGAIADQSEGMRMTKQDLQYILGG